MPRLSGIEVTRQIKKKHPDIKVLILTMHEGRDYFDHAMAAGAEGYILKKDSDTELFSAIETIRQGGVYVSPTLSGNIKLKDGMPSPSPR
jgi:DNA-binding NarL/FixJ family response regulator